MNAIERRDKTAFKAFLHCPQVPGAELINFRLLEQGKAEWIGQLNPALAAQVEEANHVRDALIIDFAEAEAGIRKCESAPESTLRGVIERVTTKGESEPQ